MDINKLEKISPTEWHIPRSGDMHTDGVIFADEDLVRDMDDKVFEQVCNVAKLPGIVGASYAMPDAHWGYGFPIGGVAAFDPEHGGVISAGGVGFDISCGVRTLHTGLHLHDIRNVQKVLADALYAQIPVGLGSTGAIRLNENDMDRMLVGGAKWAVKNGYGTAADLERTEEHGCMHGAIAEEVSGQAKKRQKDEMGTLGSGNHYLEIQLVDEIYDDKIARAFNVEKGDIKVSIHCGSRGLGHQIGTDFLRTMVIAAPKYGITLPDRELACAPIKSPIGQSYLGAMRAGINCALANRQILTHLVRRVFEHFFPGIQMPLLYDVSHNTCKEEMHTIDGKIRRVFVHRKGATRAYGPGNIALPEELRDVGQPVLIGGTMGTASYILSGTEASMHKAYGSACHGAGRAMSRHQAKKQWQGRQLVDSLAQQGILIRSPSMQGVAEEAPGAYKDVSAVVESAHIAGLANKVAKLVPLICIKG